MPSRISSLQRYQRPRRSGRFDHLPPPQRAIAEAHYQRLCARWGDDLPQWRRAIRALAGRETWLCTRDATWARQLRRRGKTRTVGPIVRTLVPPPTDERAAAAAMPTLPPIPAQPSANVASSFQRISTLGTSLAEQPIPPTPHSYPASTSAASLPAAPTGTTPRSASCAIPRALRLQLSAFQRGETRQDLPPRWAWRLELVPVPGRSEVRGANSSRG